MITEEDLSGAALAGMEPELQFRFIEQIAAKRLIGERDHDGNQIYDDYDYMSSVLEAARVFNITGLLDWEAPRRADDNWQWACREFRAEATRVSQRILFQHASRPEKDPNTVALDGATKQRLRFHVGQMRGIIDKQTMPDWWKGDLHKVLTELEREIDKARTRLAAVLDVVGKAIDGSEPVIDAVRKVVTIFQDAKAGERKKAKLAAPIELKQIEPPKPDQIEPPKPKKLAVAQPKPKKNGFEKPIDDEIPF
jgi:hypothetical protein